MADSQRLVDLIQDRLDRDLAAHRAALDEISPDLGPIADEAARFLRGGKRFRARFLFWGWQAVAGQATGFDPTATWSDSPDLPAVVTAASALEYFHASALVHDDVIDNSDTRRGRPSAHRALAALHRDAGWDGDRDGFGRSAAILLGDLLFGWSDELFGTALGELPDPTRRQAAREHFDRMRTEVIAGQYLDVLEEQRGRRAAPAELLERAHRVIVYKSAKYSVQAPLAIGAAMAGGSPTQIAALDEFGLPLGIAFQLRDDLLGVFGDPATTGKPSGDDLREGKQTVLIAIARHRLPATMRRLVDELVGDPHLDAEQVAMLQTALVDCGAVEQVEALITREARRAREALDDAPLSPQARSQLVALVDQATQRDR